MYYYRIIHRRHIGRLVPLLTFTATCYDFKQNTSDTSSILPRSCLKITRHEFSKDRKLSAVKAKFCLTQCYNSH